MNRKKIVSTVKKLVVKANTELRKDVAGLLRTAYQDEDNRQAQEALGVILENARIARARRIALCQDTGLPIVFLEAGADVKISRALIDAIQEGIDQGYAEYGFRASTIDSDRHLSYSPYITHIGFTRKKGFTITVFPKGFGSENKSQLKMFNPTVSRESIDEFIVEAVRKAGCDACPPYVVGVGIGGTSDSCLLLAKEALIGRIDRPARDTSAGKWETSLYEKINALHIGPMGLGGKYTCLAVKIKTAPTHIAGLPVGVNISCHALRSASATIRDF
ncbi:MAG: fumarate hydratase [Candidatus Omnitrophica bacterium]|nr:fumarate hydratase [Candidatus Omnitrophota bacterium]